MTEQAPPVARVPTPPTLRIMVLSDLHAFVKDGQTSDPSYLDVGKPEDAPNKHPIAGLLNLIGEDAGVRADLLLCCGDMGDKAHPAAAKYVWDRLHDVAAALGTADLYGTAGNHDVDSRHQYNKFDARGHLQQLRPLFPIGDETLSDQYWSRHYAIAMSTNYRLIVLNSAAYHGQGPSSANPGTAVPLPPEYHHGRVAESTLDRLRADLSRTQRKPVNLLLCHHHPEKFGDIDLSDYSEMHNGSALVHLLASDAAPWFVIHGHKHWPHLQYAGGGNNAPVVLAAGSFSATLSGELAGRASNQFYLIELHCDALQRVSLPLAGKVRAWDWRYGYGWKPAGSSSGLPAESGFGCREHPEVVAQRIADVVRAAEGPLKWKDLLKTRPEYDFLLPTDRDRVIALLRESHTIKVLSSEPYELELNA